MELEKIVVESAECIGYKELKDKQVEAVCSFIRGNDVFVSLPTGYGKSLIYAILPIVYDRINGMVNNNLSLLHVYNTRVLVELTIIAPVYYNR